MLNGLRVLIDKSALRTLKKENKSRFHFSFLLSLPHTAHETSIFFLFQVSSNMSSFFHSVTITPKILTVSLPSKSFTDISIRVSPGEKSKIPTVNNHCPLYKSLNEILEF